MAESRFDALSRSLREAHSRHGLRRFLGVVALAGALALRNVAETAAKRKRGKKGKKKRRQDLPPVPPVISPSPTGLCLAPGAPCTLDTQCCARVCLDNGFCGCFSDATGVLPCPDGCACHQVNPGSVGACVEDIAVELTCCGSLPGCNSNTDCGRTSFCDESVCGGGVCVRRCPT